MDRQNLDPLVESPTELPGHSWFQLPAVDVHPLTHPTQANIQIPPSPRLTANMQKLSENRTAELSGKMTRDSNRLLCYVARDNQ